MPVRTWEASQGLEEGWEPRSRSRRGGCPLAAESTREEALSEAVGGFLVLPPLLSPQNSSFCFIFTFKILFEL